MSLRINSLNALNRPTKIPELSPVIPATKILRWEPYTQSQPWNSVQVCNFSDSFILQVETWPSSTGQKPSSKHISCCQPLFITVTPIATMETPKSATINTPATSQPKTFPKTCDTNFLVATLAWLSQESWVQTCSHSFCVDGINWLLIRMWAWHRTFMGFENGG